MFKPQKKNDYFKALYNFTPDAVVIDDEIQQVVVKKPSKYLPGEKLLRTIAKQQAEQKTQKLDIDKITKSMLRVLSIF
jgi:hypothetical protein